MRYRSLLFVFVLAPFSLSIGCGDTSATTVLDGEVVLDPDVGSDVNDPAKMEELMNASPDAPK